MSQALDKLKKLIIEVVEEEVSTNEYANTQAKKRKKRGLEEKLNLFLEKNTPTNPSLARASIRSFHNVSDEEGIAILSIARPVTSSIASSKVPPARAS